MLLFTLVVFSSTFAQVNTNEKEETVETKTTVKDSKGENVITKAVTNTENQVIAVDNSGQLNQNTLMTPTNVNTNVNYSNKGVNYTFEAEKLGFRMLNVKGDSSEQYAVLRPSSQKGYYVISQNGNSSLGYFNQDGNFVVESYDGKTDAIITTIYVVKTNNEGTIQQNKM